MRQKLMTTKDKQLDDDRTSESGVDEAGKPGVFRRKGRRMRVFHDVVWPAGE